MSLYVGLKRATKLWPFLRFLAECMSLLGELTLHLHMWDLRILTRTPRREPQEYSRNMIGKYGHWYVFIPNIPTIFLRLLSGVPIKVLSEISLKDDE